MRVVFLVGLLAFVGTCSNLILHWAPDTGFDSLFHLGKWLDIEGRSSQNAYAILTGDYPDPSSEVFLTWNAVRLIAAALLLGGVTSNMRRGPWLSAYQIHLKLSMVGWVVALALCLFWNAIAFGVVLLVAVGTYYVIYHEDPVEEQERLRREDLMEREQRRQAELHRLARAAEVARLFGPQSARQKVKYLVTIQNIHPFFNIEDVTHSANPSGNSTPTVGTGEPSPLVRDPPAPAARATS